MIAVEGSTVVHLGGKRGDRLSLSRDGGPFERLADLGWDERVQTTPQRRLLLADGSLFVLEPAEGPLLAPPLRARRFDLDGHEVAVEEGADDTGEPDLYFHGECDRRDTAPLRVRRCGVDPRSGRPLLWQGLVQTDLVRKPLYCYGRPLRDGETWWYPIREHGLARVGPDGLRTWRGKAGPAADKVAGRVVCVGAVRGRHGAWVDGEWHPVSRRPLFPRWRHTHTGMAAEGPGGSIVLLRREGGDLPSLGGSAGRLPPGFYVALVNLGGTLLAVEEGEPPRLVPVGF